MTFSTKMTNPEPNDVHISISVTQVETERLKNAVERMLLNQPELPLGLISLDLLTVSSSSWFVFEQVKNCSQLLAKKLTESLISTLLASLFYSSPHVRRGSSIQSIQSLLLERLLERQTTGQSGMTLQQGNYNQLPTSTSSHFGWGLAVTSLTTGGDENDMSRSHQQQCWVGWAQEEKNGSKITVSSIISV